MTVGDLCVRNVLTVSPLESVRRAARLMRDHAAETLVVGDGRSPILGIVTDRDLVVRGLVGTDDLTRTTVGDVMTRGPVAVEASIPVGHAVRVMADQKVRSAVVLSAEGALVGLLALDDVVSFLVEEADDVARVIRPKGTVRPRMTSDVPR